MINATQISKLKVGKEIYDTQVPGLSIRRGVKGHSWYYKFYDNNKKKQVRRTLGKYPEQSIKDARVSAISFVDEKKTYFFSKCFKDFMEYKISQDARKTTLDLYNILYKIHLEPLHSRKIQEITRYDIKQLHQSITKRSPIQANRSIALVKTIYNYALDTYEECQDLPNPASKIKPNPEKKRETYLNDKELSVFLHKVYEEYRAIKSNASLAILLAATTGARKNNILSAEYKEFNFDTGLWLIPAEKSKNRKSIKVYLHPRILILVKNHFKDSGTFLFPAVSKTGHQGDIKKSLDTLTERAEIQKISMHVLRHTFVTQALNSRVVKLVVSHMVGHKSKDITTDVYGHISDQELKEGFFEVVDGFIKDVL